MNRRNRRASAPPSKSSSNRPPTSASAACQAGFAHLRAGRYLDAQISCQQALALDPDHADGLHLMGLLSRQAKNYDHAVEWIARALRKDPKAEYLSSLGTTLRQQGRFEEALKALDKAIQLKPEDAELWINLGNVLADLARPADALLAFQHGLKLDPRHWDAAYRCGFLLDRLEQPTEALCYFDLSDKLKPNQAVILQMRAIALRKLKRFKEALADNKRAHALNPDNADTCNNIGAILQSLGRDGEALPWFDKALTLRPRFLIALTNKAASLGQFHRFDEAEAIYRHMKTIDPDCAQADWDLSLLHMLTGNFEAGWAGREARWRVHQVIYPEFSQPIWLGAEDITGKTILICADEGLGDSIQFARYLPMVAARGARVILVVDDAAYPLLSASPGVSQSFPKSAGTFPAFDMHCPMSSLPLAFATRLDTIPSDTPYLPAPAPNRVQAWDDRLGPHTKLRVGLVWSGNPNHSNDHNRSVTLQTLSRLFDVDATFVSLQKDARPGDKAILRDRLDIIDLTTELTDFNETAALISCLDLVITVDTSVAHLAGALGRPTWILLPYTPDYRWLLGRDDSPWYPTVRLFRQNETRDYAEVLERVRAELVMLCAQRYPDAQISSRQAPEPNPVDPHPDDADNLHQKGLQSLQARQYDHAVELITRAIRQDPRPDYIASLGVTLHQQGRHEEALKAYDKAIQLKPEDAGLWHRLGNILLELKRLDHALLSFAHVLKLDSRHQDAVYKSGVLLHHMGRFEESIVHLDLCDAVLPNRAPTLQARARTLFNLKRFEEALAENRRAHALDPGNADTCNNIGACLQSLGREEEALSWFDRALDRLPNATEILNNKALMLSQLQRFDEAFALYDHIRALQLNDATTDWNLALLQMLTGNFDAGWAGRESRWMKSDPPPYPKFSQPIWLGKEPIEGKTILIHVDEGAGDTIQFVRYVPMVAARGARVILVVERHLHSLMSGLPGVGQCLSFPDDPLPAFDMHCPVGSLPLAFGTRLDTIPSVTSYLPSPAEVRVQLWEARLVSEARLGPHDRPRVGLVWSGNPSHRNDVNRSTSLRLMSSLLDVDATFVSLQKDPKPDGKALLAQTGIIDLTTELTDFNETAALIACLDLVITVDTGVAHLAGALGRPTWILLPYTPDYRWLLGRDDSPWYPTVRLFRQNETRDYAEVLERVRAELVALVSALRAT
jgi:tetratricopeptide (TPR) repeat protein